MILDPHTAAKMLYKMRQKTKTIDVREPVTGGTKPPLPYRHELIGMPNTTGSIPLKEKGEPMKKTYKTGICGQVEGYPGCGMEKPLKAHGLCFTCETRWYRASKKKLGATKAAETPICKVEAPKAEAPIAPTPPQSSTPQPILISDIPTTPISIETNLREFIEILNALAPAQLQNKALKITVTSRA